MSAIAEQLIFLDAAESQANQVYAATHHETLATSELRRRFFMRAFFAGIVQADQSSETAVTGELNRYLKDARKHGEIDSASEFVADETVLGFAAGFAYNQYGEN